MRGCAVPPGRLLSASLEAAKAAGLRYVEASSPGIQRQRRGRGFVYIGPDGTAIRDIEELKRIRSLVIPPAWARVWICNSRWGHIQAIGYDAKGRKQYRYHSLFRRVRDEDKFSRLVAFGTSLALIRRRVRRDLRRSGLPREKVLAAVVRLLETTCIRIGNDEYAKENASFGLVTLRNHHVKTSGETLRFRFRGKSGVYRTIELDDCTLARIVSQCQDLPGYRLFQYMDEEGSPRDLDSGDVNQYLREITGQDFTAKDFRTWVGTVLASRELVAVGPGRTERDKKSKIVAAVKRVAGHLGNRPATCRKYYIHPAMFEAYSDGTLFSVMQQGIEEFQAYQGRGLSPEEYSVMVLVTKYLEKAKKPPARRLRMTARRAA